MRCGAFAALVLATALAIGRSADAATARELLDRARALDDTARKWTDRVQPMSLLIHDGAGAERRRSLTVYTKRSDGGAEKAITFFSAPPEVKGTAFLQWSTPGKPDEQWLYLPEFRRTRQVATQMRDQSFVGTDFTYHDLEILADLPRWTEEEASSKLVGEESVDGARCYEIDLAPHQEGTPYARIRLWMDADKLTARKLEFYDRDDSLVKSLALQDIRDVGAFPTPHRLEMRNLAKSSSTLVEMGEVKYDGGLADDLFTQRYLERGAP